MSSLLAALESHPSVHHARVYVHHAQSGRALLLAAVELTPDAVADLIAIRRDIARDVTVDQLPARLVCVKAVEDGVKVGAPRPALGQTFTAPQGAIQTQLADIWAEVLDWEEVSADDDLSELGADSLTTVEALIQITDLFQPDLIDGTPFEIAAMGAKTVADYARLVEAGVHDG